MKKTIICLMVALCLLFLLPGCDNGRGTDEAPDPAGAGQLLRSALALTCTIEDEDGDPYATSYGSAIILKVVDDGAYVLTNYHVVYDPHAEGSVCRRITAAAYGQEEAEGMPAEYVWHAASYDLAILYVPSLLTRFPGATAAVIDATRTAGVGERIFAIGNTQGQGLNVRDGLISRDAESVLLPVSYQFADITLGLVRFDASVNEGDSGGAIFSKDGKLLGLINARRLDGGGGYAIPSATLAPLIDEVLTASPLPGIADQLVLGASFYENGLRTIYDTMSNTLITEYDIVVDKIAAGSIASVFLQEGDALLGVRCNNEAEVVFDRLYILENILLSFEAEDRLTWRYRRNGEEKTYLFTVSAAHIENIL